MKCPLFNSNAWIAVGSMERVPVGVQKHEIKLEIKIRGRSMGQKFTGALVDCASTVVAHKRVPALVFVLICVRM